MSADPESDILAILTTDADYTEDTNLFRGPVLASGVIGGSYPIPQKAVFVRTSASSPPMVHRSSSLEEKEWIVDVMMRTLPDLYGTGRTDAQRLLDLVNDNPPAGYIDFKTTSSHPIWVDRDDTGSHYFVFSVRVRKLEA